MCAGWLATQALGAEPPQPAAPKPAPKTQPPKAPVPPPPMVDADFLEYLANWDVEDEKWNEYLASLVKPAAKPRPVKKVDDNG